MIGIILKLMGWIPALWRWVKPAGGAVRSLPVPSVGAIAAAVAVAVIAYLIWTAHAGLRDQITELEGDISKANQETAQAITDGQAAVADAVARSQRILTAERAAAADLRERLDSIEDAEGACLDTELPAGLLD